MNICLEDEKTSWLTFWTCFITYAVITMTKNTYSAAIAAIVSEGLFSKSAAGLINACFYLVYGISQFFGGWLAERISPFKIILIGLCGSVLTNAAMAVSNSFAAMLIIWSLTGVLQFGVWPAVVKILSSVLMPAHRNKAMNIISAGYPLGAMSSYLVATLMLRSQRWPSLFWVSAVTLLLSIILFLFTMRRVKIKAVSMEESAAQSIAREHKESKTAELPFGKLWLSSGLFLLCVPAVVRCMLDLGLKSWVSTMIMESYQVSPSFSSMLTVILIFVNLFGIFIAVRIYPGLCKSLPLAIGLPFLLSFPLLLLLLLTGKIHVLIVVLLLSVITTFMTAANQLLSVRLSAGFAPYNKTATVAGIINAFACFGCMAANYLYGYTSEHFGWTVTASIWVALSLAAVIFAAAAAPLWKRFMAGTEES